MESENLIELYAEGDSAEEIVADLKRTGWVHYIKPTSSAVAHHITQFLMHDSDINVEGVVNHENHQRTVATLMHHPKVQKIASLLKQERR